MTFSHFRPLHCGSTRFSFTPVFSAPHMGNELIDSLGENAQKILFSLSHNSMDMQTTLVEVNYYRSSIDKDI